jgi:ribosomal protein S18 acetylase RimI-like enzyme
MAGQGSNPTGRGDVPQRLLDLLNQDRAWCAYALADLEPERLHQTWYLAGDQAAVVVFRGLTPAWLTIHGDPLEATSLAARIPPGSYQYALLATHRANLQGLTVQRETHMWRMVQRATDFPGPPGEAERLTRGQAGELLELFADHPDRPDAFDASQLDDGFFFGVRRQGRLVAVTGTHVTGPRSRVAAIGNVFTHPDHRGRGYGRQTGAAVVQALLEVGFETIVLNVAMANEAAQNLYRSLGFWPFCGYHEGVGQLTPS